MWHWQERFVDEGVDGLLGDGPSRIALLPETLRFDVLTTTAEGNASECRLLESCVNGEGGRHLAGI